MIDETNTKIEEMKESIRRENERRNAFYRMLEATDRVLWRLEEMNRDGVKEVDGGELERMRESLATIPTPARKAFRDSGQVQEALDSLFDVQEALFRWRNPDLTFDDGDDLEQAS